MTLTSKGTVYHISLVLRRKYCNLCVRVGKVSNYLLWCIQNNGIMSIQLVIHWHVINYMLWRCFIQTLNGAFTQCGFMALMLGNPFFVNSFSFQHSKFKIGILLQFLIRNMQNHLLPQKHFIEIAIYYASHKESDEDVTENYHHFLIHQENITHTYISCEDGNYEYLNLLFPWGLPMRHSRMLKLKW